MSSQRRAGNTPHQAGAPAWDAAESDQRAADRDTPHSTEIDHGIAMGAAGWDFSVLAPVFDSHIHRSIPLTDESREYIAALSRFFLDEGSTVYELGTSTGRLAERVLAANHAIDCRYIGLDSAEDMVDAANRYLEADPRFRAHAADITDCSFAPTPLVLSHYTLHFVPLEPRRQLLARVHEALDGGGALILYEKVRSADPSIEQMLAALYDEYKLASGFNRQQIDNKRALLSGVLQPLTRDQNLELLREAGFRRIELIHHFHCFEGYLAIK